MVKVLIVEDESIEARGLKSTLESFGHEVPYITSSDKEAVEKALEIKPDLILIDIVKDDIDSIENDSKIKKLDIPVIFLTAHSKEIKIEKIKFTEPHGFIVKPYDPLELKYAIELALYKKKMEKELNESLKNEFLGNIVENIPNMIFIKSADNLQFEMVNKAGEDLLGHSREELMGKTDYDFFPKDEADFFTQKDREVLQNKKLLDIPEEIIETKNLGQRILHTKKIPIFNKEGNPQYLLGISEDITELKKAEKSLFNSYVTLKKRTSELTIANAQLKAEIRDRELAYQSLHKSEENFRNVISKDADGIIIVNKEGIVYFVNPAAEAILGRSSSELVGESFGFPMESDEITEVEIFQKGGGMAITEMRVVETHWGGEKAYLASIHDVTKHKKMEKQLKKSLKEREMLLREIHHRVYNNMQIISSLLSLESFHVFDKRDVALFMTVKDRVTSMGLIHGSLYQSEDLSSIKFKEYVDILTAQLLTIYAPKSNIKLVTDISDISLNMETAIPVGMILNELVINSLRHAFPDLKGEISISVHSKGEEIEVIIKDNGLGLPKDMNIENPEKLGLQLVKNLVKQLEGMIELDLSQGTEFKIKFKELEYIERL